MTTVEPARGEAPLFLLSFRQRDELAGVAAGAGWRVVAARRGDGAERRMLASGAALAVVDARGAADDGLAAVAALGPIIAANGGALIVLVSRGDATRLDEFLVAGATHFLTSPMREVEFVQTLRFAERHVERVSGPWQATAGVAEPLGWRYDGVRRSLQVTPALAGLLGLPEKAGVRDMMRRFGLEDRRLARRALERLERGSPTTAFAHDLMGAGRVVHHVQRDPHTGRLHALIEPLGQVPDAGAVLRDALTGASDGNSARRLIDRWLADGSRVSIVLVTLPRFGPFNTAHGRQAGDAALRGAARRIEDATRELLGREALMARIGGAEFLVGLPDVDPARIELVASRLAEALDRYRPLGDEDDVLGVRLVTLSSKPGDNSTALLRRASEQMVANAEEERFVGPRAPLDLLAAGIPDAIARGEVEVRFQPQVAISTGAIIGVEALARWRHPEHGELGAETLFAAAERGGQDVALSEHVQRLACETAARWPAALGELRLSVNVTAADVARADFADRFLDRVDSSGFPRSRLTVEVTESGLIEELGQAARLLAELRTAGCRVAIDDFGTGYSSLAYLKALPLDYLKIDRKLSQDIAGTVRDRIVVRGVIDMARSLGLVVIAEGVETETQLDLLAKEGCQLFQGFLCAGPMTVEDLVARFG